MEFIGAIFHGWRQFKSHFKSRVQRKLSLKQADYDNFMSAFMLNFYDSLFYGGRHEKVMEVFDEVIKIIKNNYSQ